MQSSTHDVSETSHITDQLEQINLEGNKGDTSPTMRPPTGPSSVGNVHILYNTANQGKVFLGTADDRDKLIRLSGVAHDQLTRVDVLSGGLVKSSSEREIALKQIDYHAGRVVLKYTNTLDVNKPKKLAFNDLPVNPSFAFGCKVHHACHAFRLSHQVRGDLIRDHIYSYIRGIRHVTLAEFQLMCEQLSFDSGLMQALQNKVAYHTLKEYIAPPELEKIWDYCTESDATRKTKYVATMNRIFDELLAEEEARKASMPEQAKPVDENFTFVHESVAGAPVKLQPAPEKAVIKAPERKPITIQFGSGAHVTIGQLAAGKVEDKTAEQSVEQTAPEEPLGGDDGKVDATKAVPGGAQAEGVAQQESKEGEDTVAKAVSKDKDAVADEKVAPAKLSYAKVLSS